jgi:hypothetical protein
MFGRPILASNNPRIQNPCKKLLKNHPGNNPQSPVLGRASRLIHFPGEFVIGEGRYGQKCVFGDILCPKKYFDGSVYYSFQFEKAN